MMMRRPPQPSRLRQRCTALPLTPLPNLVAQTFRQFSLLLRPNVWQRFGMLLFPYRSKHTKASVCGRCCLGWQSAHLPQGGSAVLMPPALSYPFFRTLADKFVARLPNTTPQAFANVPKSAHHQPQSHRPNDSASHLIERLARIFLQFVWIFHSFDCSKQHKKTRFDCHHKDLIKFTQFFYKKFDN